MLTVDSTDSKVSTGPKTKKSTQPSRKGKKAWRKNVDITEIEETLEGIRAEERLLGQASLIAVSKSLIPNPTFFLLKKTYQLNSGKIQEISSEKLFVIDTEGDAQGMPIDNLNTVNPL